MDPTVTAAAIGVGGTVIVAVAGFWASVRNTSKTTALTLRAVELTEQGQVTDRYAKAIEQLGSDKIDIRIGGIYALERIARDSTRDHSTVMEVLAAFIREHSPERDQPGADISIRGPYPDVRAAITVIGRRDSRQDGQPVNLEGVNLAGADLSRMNLAGMILTNADLTGAILHETTLTGAFLLMAGLAGAVLSGADLSDATLTYTDLTGALLVGLGVTPDANLTGANLSAANLTDATWPAKAPVPEGWQRDTNSGHLKPGMPTVP